MLPSQPPALRQRIGRHVLLSLGLKPEECHGSLRITMGRSNTGDDVDYVAASIAEAVARFRSISALGR